ncbi:hypothetical protein CRENBAI_016078 [Crenichthys baileyi]|uniref:RRM domain-containing protein n=1 Tax=Crenichthys baileyi TaxID=28760 RepID=A0AAV9RJD5_9TELE
MSHNYPYRQPASDSDLRPDPRRYGPGADRDFYRQSQESFSSSSRSSAGLQSAPGSQDGVLSLLSSCGLEPEDLSVLAKLPEDILTVESLPQILKHIKGKKGAVQPFPPRSPEDVEFTGKVGTIKPLPTRAPTSPPSSSASFKPLSSGHWPSTSAASRDWEQLRRQPVQYPLHLISSSSAPPESQLDRWAGHKTSSSVRSPPSSSRRAVDHDHRPRHPSYGKEGSSFSTPGSVDRARPSRLSTAGSADYRSVPPRLDEDRRDSRSSYSSRGPAPSPMPSKKQALDFHGTSPAVFPYSCSLCDITVLSEKAWIQHINTTGHADGQLNLLQQFPRWDCRLGRVGRDDNQSNQRKDGPRPGPPTPRPNQNRDPQTSKKQQKASDKGKVVCAKFPPQSVDEVRLRKLIEPFGKVGKILMFPSLAFVEMGSCDQAKDVVKFYSSSDKAARKEKIEFSISNAFSFLQSSQVVSFTPAPTGEDGRSDLISIAKRFGEPLYTLFLPSKAFVEMKLSAEAQKLVDYYSTNLLRINTDTIQVSFSSEYRTLMRVPSAQKYEDEPTKTMESNRDQRTGSRERSPRQSQSEEKSEEPENSEPRSAEEPQKDQGVSTNTEASAEEEDQMGGEDQSATEDSDLEGMEVIAEDGENVEGEDDLESQEEENQEKSVQPEESLEADEQKLESFEANKDKPELQEMEETEANEEQKPVTEEKKERRSEMEQEEPAHTQDEEAEFPVDLENCITLDEVKTDDEDEGPPADGHSEGASESSRVLFFGTMPLQYTDMEFISLMRGFGTVLHYLLIQDRQQGFIEMSSSSEALKAAEELQSKPAYISGTRLIGILSEKFSGLTNGWPVPEEERSEERSGGRSTASTSEPDQKTSEGKMRSRGAPETETSNSILEIETSEIITRTQKGMETESPDQITSDGKTRSRTSPEQEPPKTSGRRTRSRKSVEKETSEMNPEEETSEEKQETLKQTSKEKTPRNGSEEGPAQRNTRTRNATSRSILDTNVEKRKGSPENNAVPLKTLRTEGAAEEEANEEKNQEMKTDVNNPEAPEPPEQELGTEREAAPAEGATEPEKPAKPVGAEFVRPVVGYFCNLCQLIFIDEDEAKFQHCSTPAHYRNYQEKTGKDPWMG